MFCGRIGWLDLWITGTSEKLTFILSRSVQNCAAVVEKNLTSKRSNYLGFQIIQSVFTYHNLEVYELIIVQF